MTPMDITLGLATGDDATVQEAAQVWAAARNRRDEAEVTARDVVGGLRGRLKMRGAELLVAQDDDARVVGFAIARPVAPASHEIYYLATDPEHWGAGVARRLLEAVEQMARLGSARTVELWVIRENERAREFYERAGYTATGEVQDTEAGRTELRYAKDL